MLALVVAGGCSRERKLATLAPVKGKVTVDGKPVTSGQVALSALEVQEKGKEGGSPAGQIDSSGNYEIFTEGRSGAPLGRYKVVVTGSMVPVPGAKGPPKTEFNQKYWNAKTTPLEINVVENAAAGAYDLKLKK